MPVHGITFYISRGYCSRQAGRGHRTRSVETRDWSPGQRVKSSGTAVVTADDSLNAPALTKARWCVYYKITKLKDHEASI